LFALVFFKYSTALVKKQAAAVSLTGLSDFEKSFEKIFSRVVILL